MNTGSQLLERLVAVLIELRPAETEDDVALLADLAGDIWREHYDGIVSSDQIEYMLETRQSPEAISRDIEEGYCYSIVLVDKEPAGYLSYKVCSSKREIFLSKFYVASPYRRKGVGRQMLSVLEREAIHQKCLKIWLTVNRHNKGSVAAYERMGFLNKGELKTDIGNGYVMDDYQLVKPISLGGIL